MSRLRPLTVELEEAIYLAVQMRAAKDNISPSDIIKAILREALRTEIAEGSGEPTLSTLIQALSRRGGPFRATNGSHRPAPPAKKPNE